MSSYHKWGPDSLVVVAGCMPPLQKVINRGLYLCEIDMSAIQSIRSMAEQKNNIIKGVSWTLESKHLDVDGDGLVAAIDIYPYVSGRTSHAPDHYKLIARAMFKAAIEEGVFVQWGGFWRGGEPFKDAPHWELD